MHSWATIFLGLFLLMALLWDLRSHRIPNRLIAAMLFTGFAVRYGLEGRQGMVSGLLGVGVGFAAFLPVHIKGGMGAGDVKLMAASGVFVGPAATALAVLYTLIIGSVMAAAKLARLRLAQGRTVPDGIPYAPAIAVGVAASLVHIL